VANLNAQTANLIRAGGDLVVSSSFAVGVEVIPPLFEPHQGLVGSSGVVSGASGLYNSWYK
jgi:hypothetical protein